MKELVCLKTELNEFFNDLCDEVRLFFDDVEIICNECDTVIELDLSDDGVRWNASAKVKRVGKNPECYIYCVTKATDDILEVKRYRKRCAKIALFRVLKLSYPERYLPWGSLTGIRPTHMLREMERELGENRARKMMLEEFDVSEIKYELANKIVHTQEPYLPVLDNVLDVYIGIPYCKTRCLYCSFPSGVRTEKTDMKSYIEILKDDISRGAALSKELLYSVRAMYIGGGTPTVLNADELDEVLEHALKSYGGFGVEFTVEAGRPDTITREKLQVLKKYGVNRISINPQTMNESTLELIGRSHTSKEFIDTYMLAREFDFDINMDIITCLPGETIEDLRYTLDQIAKLEPDNLTVHTLAIKRSSQLRRVLEERDSDLESAMPSAVTADRMVELGKEYAYALGMTPYYMYRQKYMCGNLENVGYCMSNKICIYNIDMMEETTSIMAHGAGSMSKRVRSGASLRVQRIPNPKDIITYMNKLDSVYQDKRKLFEM